MSTYGDTYRHVYRRDERARLRDGLDRRGSDQVGFVTCPLTYNVGMYKEQREADVHYTEVALVGQGTGTAPDRPLGQMTPLSGRCRDRHSKGKARLCTLK